MKNRRLETEEYAELQSLLQRRLEVIADTEWRDRDPKGQLDALKSVSEALMARHQSWRDRMSPKLEHFMSNCSYQKALDFIENELIS